MSYGAIPSVGFFSASDGSGINRYTESLQIEGQYEQELQYWLSVFNYAQQFGLPNTTIADINAQIFRVSQKLTTLRQVIQPAAQNDLQTDNRNNSQIRQLFQQQRR